MEKDVNKGLDKDLSKKELPKKEFKKKELSRFDKDLRKFGIYFSIGMTLLLAITFYHNREIFQLHKIIIAGLLLYHILFASLFPKLLVPTYYLTKIITKIVGIILTYLVFGIVYYVLFTPISFLVRLAKKDHIHNNSLTPNWLNVKDKSNNPKNIERLY
jgi:hypothetical protein